MIRRNNKRTLYESIMKDVAKTVKKHLNEVSNELLTKAHKSAESKIENLITKLKESNFTDVEILKKLQKLARQSNLFKQTIIDNNNKLQNLTIGNFNKLIKKWKNGVKIQVEDETIEIIPTFVISKEDEIDFTSSNWNDKHIAADSDLLLDVYLINIEKYENLFSDEVNNSILIKIKNVYEQIERDFQSIGLELYDRVKTKRFKKNDYYEYTYINAKEIIDDQMMCFHFKITNNILQEYFSDDFFENEDTYFDYRNSYFKGYSRSETTKYRSKKRNI